MTFYQNKLSCLKFEKRSCKRNIFMDMNLTFFIFLLSRLQHDGASLHDTNTTAWTDLVVWNIRC